MRRKLTRTILIAIAAVTLLTAQHISAQRVSDAELQFSQALRKQQVEGDLPGAIKLYQEIAAKTTDRGLKAKVLLQLGLALDSMGQQSESVYQRILKELPEQPAAEQAKARLAALRPSDPPPAFTMRKIGLDPGIDNVVAIDGQRVIYWDGSRTTLFISNIDGKNQRVVFKTRADINHGGTPAVVPSRDLNWVFLGYTKARRDEVEYALTKTDGTGYRDLTLTEKGGAKAAYQPEYVSWSWDNRYLLLCKLRPDGIVHLLKVTAADGEFVDLTGAGTPDITRAEFSPDDRFIAYTTAAGNLYANPIHIIPAGGGESSTVKLKGLLLDWTRDGRYLLLGEPTSSLPFYMNAGFKVSAVPIENGRATGAPIPVDSSMRAVPRMMANGSLVAGVVPDSGGSLRLASLDGEEHLSSWKPVALFDVSSVAFPGWSPDARQIVYVAGPDVVRLHELSDHRDRELYHGNGEGFIMQCIWARQHPSVLCGRIATDQNTEILSIAVDSGRVEKLGSLEGPRTVQGISADDRTIFTMSVNGSSFGATFAWEVGKEGETRATPPAARSNDGQWILSFGVTEERREIRIRRAGSSDEPRPLVLTRIERNRTPGIPASPVRFTPDSKSIVYQDKDVDGKDALYRISVLGGQPERLGNYPTSNSSNFLAISPDGRQFLVSMSNASKPEFWTIQNVIPKAQATSSRK